MEIKPTLMPVNKKLVKKSVAISSKSNHSGHGVVISCQDVTKKFQLAKDKMVEILHGVSFEIFATEYVIIYGPSGCGKSTLLNLVAGLEKSSSGSLKIRGEELSKLSPTELARHHRTKIGMVFQQFNLINNLSVIENVALPNIFSGTKLSTRSKRAQHLLDHFKLGDLADKIPTELSGGEQQRVALARALANNPWILLVDEPTGNLDSKSAGEVMEWLEHLNSKSRRTILLVTHNPDYLHYAHRVMYMKDGQIINIKKNRPVGRLMASPSDELSTEKLDSF